MGSVPFRKLLFPSLGFLSLQSLPFPSVTSVPFSYFRSLQSLPFPSVTSVPFSHFRSFQSPPFPSVSPLGVCIKKKPKNVFVNTIFHFFVIIIFKSFLFFL